MAYEEKNRAELSCRWGRGRARWDRGRAPGHGSRLVCCAAVVLSLAVQPGTAQLTAQDEIILDNDEDGTDSTGIWFQVTADDDWGPNVRVTFQNDDFSTYLFGVQVPSTQDYEVFLWWPPSNQLSNKVVAEVKFAEGTKEVRVNQSQNGGQWNSIGIWEFKDKVQVTLKAKGGGRTAADAMRVVAVDTNDPPTAAITSVTPSPALEGASVHLEGDSADSDGTVVAWLWESDLDGEIGATEDVDITTLTVGTHQLSFSAQDDDGAWSEVAADNLVITPLPNQPPTATILSISPNPALPGELVQFDGSGNDSDGVVIAYLWESNLDGEIGTTEDLSLSNLSLGSHTISFSVQDDDLDWSTPATAGLDIQDAPNQPPTASIVSISPSPAVEGDNISFDGSANDTDGSLIAHLWESDLDGQIGNSEDISTSALIVGTHTISYSAQDDDLAWSDPATQTLTVTAVPNQPPTSTIVSISPSPAIEGETVSFDGTASDTDGSIIAHLWVSDIAGEIGTSEDFSTSSLTVGTHTISYSVQDDDLDWSTADVTQVQINEPPNQPPTAAIVSISPSPAVAGQSVSFDGTASDTDGSIIAHLWVSDIAGEIGTSEDFSTSSLTVGTHTISYSVQDDDLDWSTADVTQVQINEPPNQPPTAAIVSISPSPSIVGQSVTINGNAGDSDGTIAEYRWTSSVDGVLGNTEDLSINSLSLGVHTLTFEARDNDDAWSDPAVALHEVEPPPNQPPTATIVSVSPNPAFEGESIDFDGSSDDPDGTVESYRWRSNLDGTLSTEEDFSSAALSIGQHTITFVVEDNDGSSSQTAAILLDVSEEPNEPPTATIVSIDPSTALDGESVSFNGGGNDSDGTIQGYLWESDLDGFLSSEEDFSTPALTVGSHSISFKVRDNDGDWSNTETSTVQIDEVPNQPPNAQILTITPNPAEVNTPVVFDGNGFDSDGNIADYSWESDVDGGLSSSEDFTTSGLSLGVHEISLRVQDDDGDWSARVTRSLEIHPPRQYRVHSDCTQRRRQRAPAQRQPAGHVG